MTPVLAPIQPREIEFNMASLKFYITDEGEPIFEVDGKRLFLVYEAEHPILSRLPVPSSTANLIAIQKSLPNIVKLLNDIVDCLTAHGLNKHDH